MPYVTSSQDFLENAHLFDVTLFSFTAGPEQTEDNGKLDVNYAIKHTDHELAILYRFDFASDDFRISCEFMTRWEPSKRIVLSAEALADFIQKDGFSTVYPYARQTIADFSNRLPMPQQTLDVLKLSDIDLGITLEDVASYNGLTIGGEQQAEEKGEGKETTWVVG